MHHRIPGVSQLELMISLCPGCHAKVERTKMVLAEMTPLLLELWRDNTRRGENKSCWLSTREGQQLKQCRWHSTILKTKLRSVESERTRTHRTL